MATYENQKAWKEIEAFLPAQLHYTEDYKPVEEIWDWKGNKVHLDTFRNPDAPAKVICFHGVGTNGRQISMILGGPLAKDDRPIFIYGLSAGGMEAYHVAAKNKSKKLKGIIGMTFLDQQSTQVRMTTTKNAFWGKLGTGLVGLSCKIGLAKFKMKMSIPSKMNTLVNDKNCLQIMLGDKTSAGNKVSMAFMLSYMTYVPEMEAKDFDICPILLTQPEKDRWTPQFLSDSFLDEMKKVKVTKTILKNGSHYPIEPEALAELHKYTLEFITEQMKR